MRKAETGVIIATAREASFKQVGSGHGGTIFRGNLRFARAEIFGSMSFIVGGGMARKCTSNSSVIISIRPVGMQSWPWELGKYTA